ncbi:hypothetical protein EC973_008147 [Apophysomyces ossiformis]|uniref:Uncharacterized protein n=1 Tax=Apophysomyces ossiformis TaxID=679940 RepID=A0A8H7BQV3_9FUNG|nr:hypothetical protein EC973_008147 [Apophysomyces ossiformis]
MEIETLQPTEEDFPRTMEEEVLKTTEEEAPRRTRYRTAILPRRGYKPGKVPRQTKLASFLNARSHMRWTWCAFFWRIAEEHGRNVPDGGPAAHAITGIARISAHQESTTRHGETCHSEKMPWSFSSIALINLIHNIDTYI